MIQIEEINIRHMIVHILDQQLNIPIFSQKEMESSYEAKEFFGAHIVKTLNDDALKHCHFKDLQHPFAQTLNDFIHEARSFIACTTDWSNQLFELMKTYIDIPPCDLAIISYTYKGDYYLAFLKLNYQNTYIHYTDFEDDIHINSIIAHKTTLPSPGQKVSEAIIIHQDSRQIQLLEKRMELDEQLKYYLSEDYLNCGTKLSSKEQMNIVKSATAQISKKYFEEDHDKKAEIKHELFQALEETGEINLETYANQVFKQQAEIKEEFLEKLEKKGLTSPVINLTEKTISRTFEKQKLKTDNGIEIKIPMEIYNDKNQLEFVTNPDGTISIILKNINKIL